MDQNRIEQRLLDLETRLARLESERGIAGSRPAPDRVRMNTPEPLAPTQPSSQSEVMAQYLREIEAPERRRSGSGNWLGLIAVVCFVLAAGFIIKLSLDSGWLTPVRQIGLAMAFGAGLIGLGLALLKSDKAYASLLPGAGVIVLYLAVFAAHRLHGLIAFEVAIAAVSAISAFCVGLYARIKHDAYAITAAAGAYSAPAVLGLHVVGIFTLYYFVLCSMAFSIISIWVRSRTLTLVSSYLAILMTAIVGLSFGEDLLIAAVLAAYFLIFSTGTFLHTYATRKPLTESEAWSFFPVLLFFYGMEYHFIGQSLPEVTPWISLGFAAFLLGLYVGARRWFQDGALGSQPLILAFATLVGVHSLYLEILPADVKPWLFVLLLGAFVFAPTGLASAPSGPFRIPFIAAAVIMGLEYMSMVFHLLSSPSSEWLTVSFASFAVVWAVIVVKPRAAGSRGERAHLLLGAAHILAVLGFYRLTSDVGSLAVSVSWLIYAAAVIGYAYSQRDELMAKSALFVLGFAAAKALLYDASSAPTLVRIVCLLVTGAVLYGAGFLFRQIEGWRKP